MAWKALVELWFVTLITSDLLIIQCWRRAAHSSHDCLMWHESSLLCVLLACISDFPSTSKILLTTSKISEYYSSYKTSYSLPKNRNLKIIPSIFLLRVWLCSGAWKKCHLPSSLFCSWSELRVMSGCFSDKIIIFLLAFILANTQEPPRVTEEEPFSIIFSTFLHNRSSVH